MLQIYQRIYCKATKISCKSSKRCCHSTKRCCHSTKRCCQSTKRCCKSTKGCCKSTNRCCKSISKSLPNNPFQEQEFQLQVFTTLLTFNLTAPRSAQCRVPAGWELVFASIFYYTIAIGCNSSLFLLWQSKIISVGAAGKIWYNKGLPKTV